MMKYHPLSKYFPLLEGEEFEMFVQDIKENGQKRKIVLYDGMILDGVNRHRACKQLGKEPITEVYDGDDPLGHIISLNIRRRHMDKSARTMLATEMLPEFEKRARERNKEFASGRERAEDGTFVAIDGRSTTGGTELSREEAAKEFSVTGIGIQRAKRIQKEAPDKVSEIVKGKTTIFAVDEEIRQKKADERAAKRKEKDDTQTVKEHPKVVKEYLDATATFRDAAKLALKGAERDRFSPEAGQFIARRHSAIRELMDALERTLQ